MFKKISLFMPFAILQLLLNAQSVEKSDTVVVRSKVTRVGNEMNYNIGNGRFLVYSKPRNFDFVRSLPRDAGAIAAVPFRKESIKPLAVIAGSTALLILADQNITDGFRKFARNIHLDASEKNKNVLNFKLGSKDVSLMRLPANLNTAVYQIGQGFPSLMIGAGLYTYGKIKNDYRALSTASQLAEAFILMGVSTQLVKRITGRQDPSESVTPGGKWHFFPSFSDYQNHTPNYDAFPSGHLATLMSSVTIFSENYPDKKWIKPVGFSITGLVALSMINNKVHWASDYPLALGMGYLCAKQVSKRSRKIASEPTAASDKKKGELRFTFTSLDGVLLPGVIYTF